jgi:hypothetical protein
MIVTRVSKSRSKSIRQGDIYRNIECLEYIREEKGILEISKISYPYVMVLSQACDLRYDYQNRKDIEINPGKTQDKHLISALVVPLFNAGQFIRGEHLSELKLRMRSDMGWDSTEGKKVMNNQLPRFHYLKFPNEVNIVDSVLDFKHFFTISIEVLYRVRRKNFVCTVSPLFREEISDRFAFYVARIGLPES